MKISPVERMMAEISREQEKEARNVRGFVANPDFVVSEDYVDGAVRVENGAQRKQRRARERGPVMGR